MDNISGLGLQNNRLHAPEGSDTAHLMLLVRPLHLHLI